MLREQIVEVITNSRHGRNRGKLTASLADDIMALIPKPTVKLPCDKCGGNYKIESGFTYGEGGAPVLKYCPHCTDGKVTVCSSCKQEVKNETV